MKAALLVCLAAVPAGCQSTIDASGDPHVHLTWEKSKVILPNGKFTDLDSQEFRNFTSNKKLPVILYFHGSGGLREFQKSRAWIDYAKRLKAIFVAPDSFARPGRFVHSSNLWMPDRLREIDYALAQVRRASWADQQNIFSIGLSQGSWALVMYDKPGFRAVVITGFHCQHHHYTVDLPIDIPVLNAQHPFDPLFKNSNRGVGTCEGALRNRPGSEVFEWSAPAVHDGNAVSVVRDKVVEFIKRNMR